VDKNTLFGGGCEDQFNQEDVTCGYAWDGGWPVAYSQGFCCDCGFLSSDDKRGGSCQSFIVNKESAHCLRMDELKYGGMEIIGPPITVFDITIRIAWTDKDGNPHDESVIIGPQSPGVSTNDGKIVARLLGSFAPNQAVPDYSDWILFIPSKPDDHPRVGNGVSTWMLIRRDQVSIDGRECNKIGTSYEAFATQGSKCSQPIGTCLGGQLQSFYEEGTHFFYPQFGGSEIEYIDLNVDPMEVNMKIFTSDHAASVVTLTLDASEVSYTLNVYSSVFVFANFYFERKWRHY